MLNTMVEFYVGLTNLTVCLPMTLVKAWHLSRTRKFDVQKVQQKLNMIEEFEEEQLIKDDNVVEIELDFRGQEHMANSNDPNSQIKKLKADKPLSKLIESFEGKISQQLVEHRKQFHKSTDSLNTNNESKRKVWTIVNPMSSGYNNPDNKEKSLSVASRVKLLEPKFQSSGNKETSPQLQEKKLSVAERVKSLDNNRGVQEDICEEKENVHQHIDGKNDLTKSKQFVRLPSGRTRAEIKHLNEMLKSQSNILSCSSERLDRIEINFEKLSGLLLKQLEEEKRKSEKNGKSSSGPSGYLKSRKSSSEEIKTVEENIERAITPPYLPVQDMRYKKKKCGHELEMKKNTKNQTFSQFHKRLRRKEYKPRGEDAIEITYGNYKQVQV